LRQEKEAQKAEEEETKEVEKANFGLSGALAKDERTGNTVNGVLLSFNEPADAAMPTRRWRLYVLKGDEQLETLHIHRKTAYLFGRDTRVADVETAHPTCSKQHAVLQFRAVVKKNADGSARKENKPYIMDLGSTHKTFLNGEAIEEARYYELLEKDCVKFGMSSREYILLHDESV
jgi:smad nuclear-interacting protein 1